MTRRLAFILVAVVAAAGYTASAQGRFGTSAMRGTSTRSQVPPPPPAPPAVPGRPDGPQQGVLHPTRFPARPLSPPGLTPMPVAQLMSDGISQLRAPAGVVDPFQVGPRFYRSRANRGIPLYGGYYSPLGYGYGGYADYAGAAYVATATQQPADAVTEFGFLRLDVQPGTAEVYIDGFYVSTVDDFSGSGPARAIEAGPHRVEIRAEGRQTVSFEVRITPNETTSYRRDLVRADDPRQARNVAPAVPKTFYVIPKCYAGDKPPTADNLPKGCLASNVKRIPPAGSQAK